MDIKYAFNSYIYNVCPIIRYFRKKNIYLNKPYKTVVVRLYEAQNLDGAVCFYQT